MLHASSGRPDGRSSSCCSTLAMAATATRYHLSARRAGCPRQDTSPLWRGLAALRSAWAATTTVTCWARRSGDGCDAS